MNKETIEANLHGHPYGDSFHTHYLKKTSFDKITSAAIKRMGNSAVLGVCSWENDREFEIFMDSESKRYDKVEIGTQGRAFYAIDKKNPEIYLMLLNGKEMVTNLGHFLISGLERDITLDSGGEVSFETTKDKTKQHNAFGIIVHPFHLAGMGPYLKKYPHLLENIAAIEIVNGEAYFPYPVRKANEKALEFFLEVHPQFPNLGGIVNDDYHSVYEIGRNTTSFPKPKEMLRTDKGLEKYLSHSLASCTPEKISQHKTSPFWGRLGALEHGIYVELLKRNWARRSSEE